MSTKRDSPFLALESLRASLPEGTQKPDGASGAATEIKRGPARAVVRLEKKQRRGKEVTVVEKLGLSKPELERWCRELKQALGCGGAVEGDAIMLQGDLRSRVPDVLTGKGVAKVTVG